MEKIMNENKWDQMVETDVAGSVEKLLAQKL